MKVLREVTEWATAIQPNHVYLVEGDKIVAYQPHGEGAVVHFEHRARLDRARRKFCEEPVDDALWGISVTQPAHIVSVAGSKGKTYEVNLEEGSCTCTGYRYHGRCKHLAQAQEDAA